jgi:hypothetical protein
MMYLRCFYPNSRTMASIFKTLHMMEWPSVLRTRCGYQRTGVFAVTTSKIDFVTFVKVLFSSILPGYNHYIGFSWLCVPEERDQWRSVVNMTRNGERHYVGYDAVWLL